MENTIWAIFSMDDFATKQLTPQQDDTYCTPQRYAFYLEKYAQVFLVFGRRLRLPLGSIN